MDRKLQRYYVVTRDKQDIIAIAYEIYGSGGMAGKILRENPGVYQLKAGMVLNLPVDEPQKNITADQAMRLEFAGLRNAHRPDIVPELEDEAEIVDGREQLAREIIGLLRESGLLALTVNPFQNAEPRGDLPENVETSETVEKPFCSSEKQADIEVEKEDCPSLSQQENIATIPDIEPDHQSGSSRASEG